ncbi:MAG: phenylalanine--tRNA ligase subunit beta [Bdellovibrionota bacterium]
MKISQSWLNDFVPCSDLTPDELYELITTKVAEVDGVHRSDAPAAHAIVARVQSVKQHPSREKLKVATVQLGSSEAQVVCGASNCVEGSLVAYVAPGETLLSVTDGATIKVESRDLAGIRSDGVLVSEAELGLTGDHSGLLVLSSHPRAKPGAKLTDVIGAADTVIEIDNKSLTHRPDLWSHFGFAREIGAILGRPLSLNADRFADDSPEGRELLASLAKGKANFTVTINPATKVRRFTALEFGGVAVQPSPLWMRRRLYAVGAGVRNFLVDLSNYVMHDIGQPNHAYDADLLQGSTVSARLAKPGESFMALDGVERALTVEDVVIADSAHAVALGGVIGGMNSSIVDTTTRLLLESANFDPVVIRMTTKRQQVRTDASNRFEKSRSPYSCPLALHRFAELLLREQPSAQIVGGVSDAFPEPPKKLIIQARPSYIRSRLGPEVSEERIVQILSSLGFHSTDVAKEKLNLEVPYERATRDITIEDDLVEEVGRIYGYNNIVESAPAIESVARPSQPILALENSVRDRLAGMGFSEAYNYSFMSAKRAAELGFETASAVRLLNPIDATSDLIRTTLVPGAIELLEKNARFVDDALLFEIGRAYSTRKSDAQKSFAASERRLLSLAFMTSRSECDASAVLRPRLEKGSAFYGLMTAVKRVCRLVSPASVTLRPLDGAGDQADDYRSLKAWMHPFRAASITVHGKAIGVLAELNPAAGFAVSSRAAISELDIAELLSLETGVAKFRHLSKYPDSFFEMSVVIPDRAYYAELEDFLRGSTDSKLLRSIEVLDVYRGKPLKETEKSISVRMAFGSDERTLSGEEISALQEQLISAVRGSKYSLRG